MTDIAEHRCTEAEFLLVKRGLYYRPNEQGYTGIKAEAGRYLESDACPESEVIAVHQELAPMFSKSCWDDVKVMFLLGQIKELQQLAHQYANDLRYPPTADSIPRRLAAIEAVLVKLEI